MATEVEPLDRTWPTATAVLVSLGWFAVLALAMWIGSNGPRPIMAWFVAYPMFALYPGVAAFAAVRTRSSTLVMSIAALVPSVALAWALLPSAIQEGPRGIRDERWIYAVFTLVSGLGLLVGIRAGTRLMRFGTRTIRGFVVAGAIFIAVTALAFIQLLSVTAY
jgi:hypothetical protein